ncbi:LysE-family membrane transport protein [Burkholderia pseudomallei 305]|nr:LysE-family membrane transport protein [Burkholderia pseudomallei 305]
MARALRTPSHFLFHPVAKSTSATSTLRAPRTPLEIVNAGFSLLVFGGDLTRSPGPIFAARYRQRCPFHERPGTRLKFPARSHDWKRFLGEISDPFETDFCEIN